MRVESAAPGRPPKPDIHECDQYRRDKRGIERLPTGAKRNGLEQWLEVVLASMDGRILACNSRVAETWGEMRANLERQGQPMPLTESLIAAIAKRHTLTLATRNTADFAPTGLRIVNPFL